MDLHYRSVDQAVREYGHCKSYNIPVIPSQERLAPEQVESFLPELIRDALGEDKSVAQHAIAVLRNLSSAVWFDALAASFSDANEIIRGRAVLALRELHSGHPDAPARLVQLLKDTSTFVRRTAITTLSERYLHVPGVLQALTEAALDSSPVNREKALAALTSGPFSQRQLLLIGLRSLLNPDTDIKLQGAEIVAKIPTEVVNELEGELTLDEAWRVCRLCEKLPFSASKFLRYNTFRAWKVTRTWYTQQAPTQDLLHSKETEVVAEQHGGVPNPPSDITQTTGRVLMRLLTGPKAEATKDRLRALHEFATRSSLYQAASAIGYGDGDHTGVRSRIRTLAKALQCPLIETERNPGCRLRTKLTAAGSLLASWLQRHPEILS